MSPLVVELCLGSSCFARGNGRALALLEQWISEQGLSDMVTLSGHLCMGSCSQGPNLSINGISYSNIAPEAVVDLVRAALSACSR